MNIKIFAYNSFSKAFVWIASIGRMLDSKMYWYQFFEGSVGYEVNSKRFCMDAVLMIPIKSLIYTKKIKDTRLMFFKLMDYEFSIFNDWTVRFEKKDNEIWLDYLDNSLEVSIATLPSYKIY